MKTLTRTCSILALLILVGWLALVWQDRFTGTSKLELTGPSGVPFSGYVIANGHRLEVEGKLPWSFQGTNVTRCEFIKVNPMDAFHFEFLHKSVGESFGTGDVSSSKKGVKVQMGHR